MTSRFFGRSRAGVMWTELRTGTRLTCPEGGGAGIGLMSSVDLALHAEDERNLSAVVSRLREDANARIVFLLDRNGHALTMAGEMGEADPTALASLAAGNVAASEGLAKLVGEKTFATLWHEGERDSLHISAVGSRLILIVVFDERSSLGLVRLRVRKATADLSGVVEQIQRRPSGEAVVAGSGFDFSDLTDADVDRLFDEN